MGWLEHNWIYVFAGLYVADKIVKLTPTPYDDLVVDIVIGGLRKLLGKPLDVDEPKTKTGAD